MTSEIRTAFQLATDYLLRLTDDVADEQACCQPEGVKNHAIWTLGHLCCSFQAMAGELRQDAWLPNSWPRRFATGTQPSNCAADYPSLSVVRETFVDAVRRIDGALAGLSPQDLASPLPDEHYRRTLPTVRHALLHILVGHASVHAGQLSVWRSAMRLPRQTERFDRNAD